MRISEGKNLRGEFFFFNDTATTEIYTLSLHDALPIWKKRRIRTLSIVVSTRYEEFPGSGSAAGLRLQSRRSEEHTSELQSH